MGRRAGRSETQQGAIHPVGKEPRSGAAARWVRPLWTCGRIMKVRPRSKGGVDYYCGPQQRPALSAPHKHHGQRSRPAVWDRVRAVIVDPRRWPAKSSGYAATTQRPTTCGPCCGLLPTSSGSASNLTNAVAMLDDPDAAAPLVAQLRALAERRRALDAEQDALARRQATWQSAQARRRQPGHMVRDRLGPSGYADVARATHGAIGAGRLGHHLSPWPRPALRHRRGHQPANSFQYHLMRCRVASLVSSSPISSMSMPPCSRPITPTPWPNLIG